MHTTLPSNDHQEIKTEIFKMAIPSISLTPYILPFHSPPYISAFPWNLCFSYQVPPCRRRRLPYWLISNFIFIFYFTVFIGTSIHLSPSLKLGFSSIQGQETYNGSVKPHTSAIHSFTFGLRSGWP